MSGAPGTLLRKKNYIFIRAISLFVIAPLDVSILQSQDTFSFEISRFFRIFYFWKIFKENCSFALILQLSFPLPSILFTPDLQVEISP